MDIYKIYFSIFCILRKEKRDGGIFFLIHSTRINFFFLCDVKKSERTIC